MIDTENVSDDHVGRFREDLRRYSVDEVVRRYITTGVPVALDQESYFKLRQTVASQFEMHPSSVILVGSLRLGFSIKPTKCFSPANDGSDLDLAIIDREFFEKLWDGVFEYAHNNAAWRASEPFKNFKRHLFNGWIDPRGLPSVKTFVPARKWVEFFRELEHSRQFGPRGITARLYKSWRRLECYQSKAVEHCKRTLLEPRNA